LQALLAACLLLPAVQPWRQSTNSTVEITTAAFTATPGARHAGFTLMPLPTLVALILITGAAIRLGMLALGFWRLRRYRRDSRRVLPPFQELQLRMGVQAEVRISSEISGPVTFGFLRPVILLPEDCVEDESIACHELLHVRRRDWLLTVIEECILSIFWFHPAVWWLEAQIQLAREETVDREAVQILNSRERYLESLLALATARAGSDLIPASQFLRKRHLQERVAALLKEISMSRLRLNSALAMFTMALALVGLLAVRSFPLEAAPQDKLDGFGIAVEQNGLTLLHRVPVAYPREALEKGVEGDVMVELTLSPAGLVSDARVLSGPEELRKATLESVLQWHYAHDTELPSKTQATIKFRLPKDKPVATAVAVLPSLPPAEMGTVKQIDLRVPDALRQKIESRVRLQAGDQLTPAALNDLVAAARELDEHLRVGVQAAPDKTGSVVTISLENGPPQRIRVGGNAQQANLVEKVIPRYPAQAKQDHVEGKVRFSVLIGKDGHVQNVELISGEPVLADAAKEAVEKWVYKPTLLNGQAVEVLTQVDVNFTLAR
jgi:TonB family protein